MYNLNFSADFTSGSNEPTKSHAVVIKAGTGSVSLSFEGVAAEVFTKDTACEVLMPRGIELRVLVTGNSTYQTTATPFLYVPTVTVAGSVATWTPILGAKRYFIVKPDGTSAEVQSPTTTFTMAAVGTYKIQAQNTLGQSSNFVTFQKV